jgi:hypothetical protein
VEPFDHLRVAYTRYNPWNDDIDYNQTIYRLNAFNYQHLIGELCITMEYTNGKDRYALVDTSTGQLVLYYEAPDESNLYAFTTTAMIELHRDQDEIKSLTMVLYSGQ